MRRLATFRYHVPPLARLSRAVVPLGSQLPAGRPQSRHHQSSCAAVSHATTTPITIEEPPNPREGPDLRGHKPHPADYIDAALEAYHNSSQGLDTRTQWLAQQLATERNDNLAIVTAQMILYMSPKLGPNILALLPHDAEWDNYRLSKVIARGYESNELLHWAQVLLARTSDERARLFLSGRPNKPAFLLNYIISDKNLSRCGLMSRENMSQVMNYCKVEAQGLLHASQDTDAGSAAPTNAGALSPGAVIVRLNRLLHLARCIEPKGIVTVARLATLCLKRAEMCPSTSNTDTLYRRSCRIFNSVLQNLSIPTPQGAYANRHLNWKGILEMLKYSSGLERPLVIDGESYRAIRKVLLGLAKTHGERDTATALPETWPPYRILRNGIEEQMPLETFNSRAIKAGAMMYEAGYQRELPDLVIDALAGKAPDGSPTIQTRAMPPWEIRSSNDLWAAQVRATRNAEEAWLVFRHPPEADLAPDSRVCEQLIYKLVAEPASVGDQNLPGDGRETFPFSDLNYSDVEKARIAPPTVSQFISGMHTAGIPLEGRALNTIVRYAPDCRVASEYIRQSALSASLKALLYPILKGREKRTSGALFFDTQHMSSQADVRDLPYGLVHAVVVLLCRSQPNNTGRTDIHFPARFINRVHAAHLLVREYAAWQRSELWDVILEALARPNIMLKDSNLEENELVVLAMSGSVLAEAQIYSRPTLSMFEHFARTIRKTMQSMLPALISAARDIDTIEPEARGPVLLGFLEQEALPKQPSKGPVLADWPSAIAGLDFDKMMASSQAALKGMWSNVASYQGAEGEVITATCAAVNNYMKALAFLGDHVEMSRLLGWTLQNLDEIIANSESKINIKNENYLSRALYAFRAFAEPFLDKGSVAALRRQVKTLENQHHHAVELRWPSQEGVAHYLQDDRWGHQQNLSILIELAKEYRSRDRGDGDDGARRKVKEMAAEKSWWEKEDFMSHISRIKAGLAEGPAGPELALYKRGSA